MRNCCILLLSLVLACQRQPVPINNITQPPEVEPADTAYAGVYRTLDGSWEGTFYIYQDTARKERSNDLLFHFSESALAELPLQLSDSLRVRQRYTSQSPYFQKVKIWDTYPESGKTVESAGVNKVQNGQMWCVVRKPEETVIHRGSLEGEHTIVWQRSEQNPQKIEYFRETVQENRYDIIGWGYYEGQDTSLMPLLWFEGRYKRIQK